MAARVKGCGCGASCRRPAGNGKPPTVSEEKGGVLKDGQLYEARTKNQGKYEGLNGCDRWLEVC